MNISKIQYISPQYQDESYFEEIQKVIDAGADWIQVRVKNLDYTQWLEVAKKTVDICKRNNVICIINDNPQIALESNADGVHLGKNDMSPLEARKILRVTKIIGGTANSFDDILNLIDQGVDYVGFGPFRFTTTKKNLSPIVGLDGYKSILESCKKNGITTPIIAIGGITGDDVPSILETGIYGFAFSSYIANAVDKKSLLDGLKKVLA
jgi:thiamine-phosphate pyrophosphorylase